MQRIQKRALRNVFGYEVQYEDALIFSGITTLHERRADLCKKLFTNIVNNPSDSLHHLVLFNDRRDTVNLRHKRPFRVSVCKTNRCRDTFINKCASVVL